MIDLRQIKARIDRLRKLTIGLGREITKWNGAASPLLHGEQRRYMNSIQGGLAGLDDARVVLARAAARLEQAGGA